MSNSQTDLINAARGFMIDVFAKAPVEALQGRTAEGLFNELYALTAKQAAAQIKHAPDGAASVILAQAIKAATLVSSRDLSELDEMRRTLARYAVTEDFDFPGDSPVSCGLCNESVASDGVGHSGTCLIFGEPGQAKGGQS
ncbi:hypothetical protein [Thalassospira sp.]|uniref:hypothetical protein n=1 Tax=Thalassospira sp. TaxID=1912094 RepID=UPI000C54ADCA|nr:hypothetical protein [Thalassospira sp.]MBC05694.1 hypothetical protein [Thalassospira sp.]|tara:strand:+ start:9261 stop:9683 length:423 start_codon:yes stop_codon:yes gene_type:complete